MKNYQLFNADGDLIEESMTEIVYDNNQRCWLGEGWIVTDNEKELFAKPSEEFQAASVRSERNSKLAATDWTQGKDISSEISDAWAVYRQALRDLPQQDDFPWDVVWPDEPSFETI